jgi:GGDEF domain-containing protein
VAVEESTPGLEHETDELTGFGTRSVLLRDLEDAVEPGCPPSTLGILDLHGFLDRFGRIDGEAHVGSVARHLAGTLEGARFYRPREHELAVLVQAPAQEAERLLSVAASSVNAHLGQQRVAVVFSLVTLPDEAGDPVVALRLAESRHIARRRPRERRLYPRD